MNPIVWVLLQQTDLTPPHELGGGGAKNLLLGEKYSRKTVPRGLCTLTKFSRLLPTSIESTLLFRLFSSTKAYIKTKLRGLSPHANYTDRAVVL